MKMRKTVSVLGSIAALALLGTTAQATLLGTINHDYGTGPGQVSAPSLGAGTCDTLNSNSITVTNGSGCQRFYDSFDFSGIAYDSISHFELTLGFADTNTPGGLFNLFRDDWRVRPASSPVVGSSSLPEMTRSDDYVEQTFLFEPSLDVFADILGGEAFYLWFAQQRSGSRSFELHSASLSLFGESTTAVPAPAPLALLLGGLGLIAVARRKPRA